jgi:murein DD-endopeptidase MepM/ murein hydrolase activator NlpD
VRPALAALLVALVLAPAATAAGNPDVAALQVGLQKRGLYFGTIDGNAGASTLAAVQALPGLSATGAAGLTGSRVRRALGAYGAHPVGSRAVAAGASGWDAAAIQFMLAWHGFPSATFDGSFGSHVTRALEKFDVWAGLPVSDVAGPAVIAALQQPLPTCAIALQPPLVGPHGSGFGPRGSTFHTGVDYPAAVGTEVHAAAAGRVTWAGPMAGGWGIVETIAHGNGVTTMYAHLSKAIAPVGRRVTTGQVIGAVGQTGHAFGPHVHFEVRVRDAAVDPFTGLNRS